MNDAPQEIKARLPIEEFVGQYVQLKKVGRSFKGLCPFHNEKTPSFIVSPDKGIAYCFGCHRGGDIFKFMQEIEGIDFVDALKLLAERTGIKLDNYHVEKKVSVDEKDQLLNIHEIAATFYEKNLWESKDGEKVLQYLQQRGLKDETIKFFRLGFSPDSYDVTNTLLLKEGFQKKTLVISGLAMTQETTFDKIYDRFRGRLMFPIQDSLSRVVAFGGRALKKDQEPKYLNSPETPIYHKSNILYAFTQSKNFIKKKEAALIVEGYMDAIAAYQSGLQYVVASSGTALTVKQLRLLQPFAKTLYFAFDMDSAGQEAGQRAYELSLDFEFQIKTVELPEGKDIAEFAQNHAEELEKVISESKSYGEYFTEQLLKKYNPESFTEKRKILQEFHSFFAQLKSSLEKDFFVRKLATDLQLTEIQIYDEMRSFKLPRYHPARNFSEVDEKTQVRAKKYQSDELLLGFMIEFPRIAMILGPKIHEDFFTEELKPIYNTFFHYYNGQGLDKTDGFIATLSHSAQEKAALVSLYVLEKYGEMSEESSEQEMNILIDNIVKKIFTLKCKNLEMKIKEAEQGGDKILSELLQEFNTLKNSLRG